MEFEFPRMKKFTAGWIQRPQKGGRKKKEKKKEAKVRGHANGSSASQASVNHPSYLAVGEGVCVDHRGINAEVVF